MRLSGDHDGGGAHRVDATPDAGTHDAVTHDAGTHDEAVAAGAVWSIMTDLARRDPHATAHEDADEVAGEHRHAEPPVPPAGPLADLVYAFLAAARERLADLVGTAGQRELAAVLGDLARLVRGAEAATIAVAGDVHRRGLFVDDGHRTVKNWLLASHRQPSLDAVRQVQTVGLVRDCPRIDELLAEGRIGVAQVRLLARAHAHPRVGRHVTAALDTLVDWAVFDDYDLFTDKLREFERLVDTDGANRSAEAAHRDRCLTLSTVGDRTHLSGSFGNAQAAVINAVLEAFANSEYLADCDEAKARYGDGYSQQQLSRTARQRRADALAALCEAAAAAPLDAKPVEVCVNIVVDQQTFERQLAELVDPLRLHRDDAGELAIAEPADVNGAGTATAPTRALCQTNDGASIPPIDAVIASFSGHVRRVVIGTDGVIIDLGRRRRLFTGSARAAAILQGVLDRNGRCIHPGCTRVSHCQIDHSREWQHDGVTATANAGIECGPHNRFKSRGYTTRRDHDGHWHTYRPDRTELRAA